MGARNFFNNYFYGRPARAITLRPISRKTGVNCFARCSARARAR